MTTVLIILLVMFLLCCTDHEKHPGAAVTVEYGWIIVGVLIISGILAILRGCAAA
jgi:hypothetical protein